MKEEKEFKISYWAAHASTIVSVTLVLLLIGIIIMISLAARKETRRIKESVELSAIMRDSVSDGQAKIFLDSISRMPFVNSASLITKAQAMQQWKVETGEDLEAVFGVNPLSPEVEFSLKEAYANPDSIKKIEALLRHNPIVEDVASPEAEMVEKMNGNIEAMSVVLGGIAIVMLVISYVLINNTVRLTIYSRRFTIHTMKLVGATNGFISKPAVLKNMLAGIISGFVAAAVLAVTLAAIPQDYLSGISSLYSWGEFAAIAGGMIVGGGLICAIAAWLATYRYLRKDYGELFK